MEQATVILTDSGGRSGRAPSLGIPVLVMRETTERREGVEAGNAKRVGTHRDTIVAELKNLLTAPDARASVANGPTPTGMAPPLEKLQM